MVYGESTKIKNDLGITDASQDTNITNWVLKADDEVDNLLYDIASKSALLTALPVLPLTTPPQSIKDASSDLAKEQYYAYIRDYDSAKFHRDAAEKAINQYVLRLRVDAEIYGTVVGDRPIGFTRDFLDTIP